MGRGCLLTGVRGRGGGGGREEGQEWTNWEGGERGHGKGDNVIEGGDVGEVGEGGEGGEGGTQVSSGATVLYHFEDNRPFPRTHCIGCVEGDLCAGGPCQLCWDEQ